MTEQAKRRPSKASLAKRAPWLPTEWDIADAGALQRMQNGEATPEDQKRILDFLIVGLCRTYEPSYYPDPYDTAFAEGRRYVGLQLVTKLNTALSRIKR